MRPILVKLFAAGVMGLGVVSCSGTHEPRHERTTPVAAAPARAVAGVDVPSLLGLSIDEMSRRVGPPHPVPAGFADPTLAPLVQRNAFLDSTTLLQCRGLSMVASYDYHSRQVSDLLLLGHDENELMQRARLTLGAPHYLVLPVFQGQHPTQLLGLRVLAVALND